MLVSLAVAAVLAITGAVLLCALETLRYLASPAGPAGHRAGRATASPADRPALVNVVLTSANPGTAAYQATVLDLAARGHLGARTGPPRPGQPAAGLWLFRHPQAAATAPAADSAPPAGRISLKVYEELALLATVSRLSSPDGAPFEVAAEACTADVAGTWQPFEQELRRESRLAGLTRPTLPSRGSTFLLFCAVTAAVAATPGPAASLAPRISVALTSVAAVVVLWVIVGWLAGQDRLTAAGKHAARQLGRQRAALSRQPVPDPAVTPPSPDVLRSWAMALAMRLPHARRLLTAPEGRPAQRAGPSAAAGSRRLPADAPRPLGRPSAAWSDHGGTWRRAGTGKDAGPGIGAGFVLLAAAAWIGLLAYAFSLPAGTDLLPLILAVAAAVLGAAGAATIVRRAAMRGRATFDGQVIARWQETGNTEQASYEVPHISVDDGQQAWTFAGEWPYCQVVLGDHVRVTVNPRSRALIDLHVTRPPGEAGQPA